MKLPTFNARSKRNPRFIYSRTLPPPPPIYYLCHLFNSSDATRNTNSASVRFNSPLVPLISVYFYLFLIPHLIRATHVRVGETGGDKKKGAAGRAQSVECTQTEVHLTTSISLKTWPEWSRRGSVFRMQTPVSVRPVFMGTRFNGRICRSGSCRPEFVLGTDFYVEGGAL